ncbi:MAG: lysophospholipase [Bacilli bacterium]|nr:lysophospholipase [Bacilli bacterium]
MAENEKKKSSWFTRLTAGSIFGALKSFSVAGAHIASHAIFDKRGSDPETFFKDDINRLRKTRKDYPALEHRKIAHFQSGDNKLTAYFYEVPKPKGIVVCVHGFTSMADGLDAAYQNYFVTHGWDVFAVDLTASGRSEGDSIIGMHQSAYDVAAALHFIHKTPEISKLPICLLGHSWGAYGVSSSLNFDQTPKAVAEMSGYAKPDEVMSAQAGKLVGPLVGLFKPDMDTAVDERVGKEGFLSAIDGINKARKTHVLLIHGDLDPTIPLENCSLYGYFDQIKNKNAKRYLCKGKAHDDIWYSLDAINYTRPFIEEIEEIRKKAKSEKEDENSPKLLESIESVYSRIDLDRSSEIDESMFQYIESFFLSAI